MSSSVKANPSELLVQASSCSHQNLSLSFCSVQFLNFKNLSELCIFRTSVALLTWFEPADNLKVEQKRGEETQVPYIEATESVAVSEGGRNDPTLSSSRSLCSPYLIQHLAAEIHPKVLV